MAHLAPPVPASLPNGKLLVSHQKPKKGLHLKNLRFITGNGNERFPWKCDFIPISVPMWLLYFVILNTDVSAPLSPKKYVSSNNKASDNA